MTLVRVCQEDIGIRDFKRFRRLLYRIDLFYRMAIYLYIAIVLVLDVSDIFLGRPSQEFATVIDWGACQFHSNRLTTKVVDLSNVLSPAVLHQCWEFCIQSCLTKDLETHIEHNISPNTPEFVRQKRGPNTDPFWFRTSTVSPEVWQAAGMVLQSNKHLKWDTWLLGLVI